MITEIQLSTLIFVVAVIWAILLLSKGIPLSKSLFEPFSTVSGVLVIILSIFDKWGWHWKIFYPWLVSTPYLEGTWKGKIQSNWVDPETNKVIPSVDAYLVVHQKFSLICTRLITEKSSSELLGGDLIKDKDETWQIIGTYINTPRILLRGKNTIHHGAMILRVIGQPPNGLEGQYWTDRDTKGEMVFTNFSKKKFQNFTSASKARFSKKQ